MRKRKEKETNENWKPLELTYMIQKTLDDIARSYPLSDKTYSG